MSSSTVERKNLTASEKRRVLDELLKVSENGKLKHGAKQKVADKFNIDRRHVSNIWRIYETSEAEGKELNLASGRKGHSGRRRINSPEIISRVAEVPLHRRRTVRSLATAVSMPRSTCHRYMKHLNISKRTSWLKPSLSTTQKQYRLRWAMDWIMSKRDGSKTFESFQNVIHIDEKWFNICRDGEKYYLTDNEELEHRDVRHKSHITKVMFLAAVGRPQWDPTTRRVFDGKLGCWPFIEEVVAKRSSKHRSAGTVETVPISATKDTYKKMILDEVIPAIRDKFPRRRGKTIYIQQDNATPHRIWSDPDIMNACGTGVEIKFLNQPPQSPDFNVLDLGFFASIQSLQYTVSASTVDELISAVTNAYKETTALTLDKVWMSLQRCFIQSMRDGGGNNYKIPRSSGYSTGSSSSHNSDEWLKQLFVDSETYHFAKSQIEE